MLCIGLFSIPPRNGLCTINKRVDKLDSFLNPASIAVFGASPEEHKLRGRISKLIVKNGYRGELYFINPSHQEIHGRRCYPNIASVPGPVDLAIIVVPAGQVIAALEQCAAQGARNALILTSGFAEEGGAQAKAQERIVEIARSTGIRVCGPNAEGFHNEIEGISATFSGAVDLDRSKLFAATSKRIGIIAQSGGIGFALYHRGIDLGLSFSQVVTVGNESDLTVAEFLNHMVEDRDSHVILLFLETVRSPKAFMAALAKAARARKPIVVVKVGRSVAGGRATSSHTASMAGWDAAYDAVFAKYGVMVVDDLDRALATVASLATNPLPRGKRAAVLTVSGGGGALAADALAAVGLELPVLSAKTQDLIRALIPSYGATLNPVDVTGQAAWTGATLKILRLLYEGDEIDFIVVVTTMVNPSRTPFDVEPLKELLARQEKPVLFFTYTLASDFGLRGMAEAGAIIFTSLSEVAIAAREMVRYAGFVPPAAIGMQSELPRPEGLQNLSGVVSEHQAKAILESCGVTMHARRLVTSEAGLQAAADAVGYPLAVKIQSADIPHKTDAGGVRLNVADPVALKVAYHAVIGSASNHAAKAKLEGVLLERMALPGTEMIVGVVRDDVFGPIITVGAGGVTTEIYRDVSRRVAPVTAVEAADMLRELKCFPLLAGFRGSASADVSAFADLICRISIVAVSLKDSIAEIECNPVIVHPHGSGCSVVDAMMVARPRSDIAGAD